MPYSETIKNNKVCAKTTTEEDPFLFQCDTYEGTYNDNGKCATCTEGLVTTEMTCDKDATCGESEILFGQSCISKGGCEYKNWYID